MSAPSHAIQVPVMLGENSLEGLMFSMAEVGDPNILNSYDWNSEFGVCMQPQVLTPKKLAAIPGEDSFL